jgi:hypothetical protein
VRLAVSQGQMRFPVKAPDISNTCYQELLKPVADPIVGNAREVALQLLHQAKLASFK